MSLTIYECACGYRSLTAGKCRSHPYPCRGMGPEMPAVEYERVERTDSAVGSGVPSGKSARGSRSASALTAQDGGCGFVAKGRRCSKPAGHDGLHVTTAELPA